MLSLGLCRHAFLSVAPVDGPGPDRRQPACGTGRADPRRTHAGAAVGRDRPAEYAAEIRARSESRLAFRVGGKLVRRPVNVGDVVKAGQVLAQIDASDLKLGQDAARAAVSAADIS